MATQAERIATLETHYEHVDKTLTAMSGTLEAVRADVAEIRPMVHAQIADVHAQIADVRAHLDGRLDRIQTRLDGRLDGIQKAIADDRVERSETKLRMVMRVTGWLVGIVTTVLGAIVGGLFLVARLLLPKLEKLASLAHDVAPLVG